MMMATFYQTEDLGSKTKKRHVSIYIMALLFEAIAGVQCHAIQNRPKEKIKTVQ